MTVNSNVFRTHARLSAIFHFEKQQKYNPNQSLRSQTSISISTSILPSVMARPSRFNKSVNPLPVASTSSDPTNEPEQSQTGHQSSNAPPAEASNSSAQQPTRSTVNGPTSALTSFLKVPCTSLSPFYQSSHPMLPRLINPGTRNSTQAYQPICASRPVWPLHLRYP